MFYSFDIFDTCITRMHAYPRDLFFDLGLRLAPAAASEAAKQRFARRFQRARIRAEKLANWLARRAGHDHADIEGIYQHLRWFMRLNRPTADLIQAELALEEESLYPIDETVENIRQLRAAGHRILFVSDMYIPARLLGPLLQRVGVMVPGDGLYVSCDAGCSKHSGRLFAHVLKAEGISGADLVHTGDNAHADIRMAQAHGIQTVHFTPAHLTEREAIIAGKHIPRAPAASWQAAFSRRCRLAMRHAHPDVAEHPLDGVIFGVIAPFLLSYVRWVLDDARERGIQRLYFVARDGEILLKIARELAPEGIELRYLYGSRRAWLPAVASPDCIFWLATLTPSGHSNSRSDIVARIGLAADDQERVRCSLGLNECEWKRSLPRSDALEFVEKLIGNGDVNDLIASMARKQREAVLSYFRQEGLVDGMPWALVDVGWALTMQAATRRLLSGSARPRGYYMALSRQRLSSEEAGISYSFIEPQGSIFSRRAAVVENVFLPPTHASTAGYKSSNGKWNPVFAKDNRTEDQISFSRHLHACASTCAALISADKFLEKSLRDHRVDIMSCASRFLNHPGAEVARSLSSHTAETDIGHEELNANSLCKQLEWSDIRKMIEVTISSEKAFSRQQWFWPEASAAISSRPVRLAFDSMKFLQSIRSHP